MKIRDNELCLNDLKSASFNKGILMHCFKNAQEIEHIHILDRAFHYGDGCFSTARLHQNQFELAELHDARLKISVERLMLKVDLNLLEVTLNKLKSQFGVLNGTLKIMISRGEGQRGYALPDHPADLYVLYYPQQTYAFQIETIASGVLSQAIGLSMPSLVGIKTLNRLEQVMLKQEALEKGWIEALVTDVQGGIVEGVSSNCFIRINNRWITPELRYNGVHGVMRAEILARMQTHGIVCEQRYIPMDEISNIQSLFFCNALSPMKAVEVFEQRPLDLQPCFDLFKLLQLNQMHDYVQSSISNR